MLDYSGKLKVERFEMEIPEYSENKVQNISSIQNKKWSNLRL